MKKKHFTFAMLPEGAVVVTKEERDALNEYSEKLRRKTIETVFSAVENLLTSAEKVEKLKANVTAGIQHEYGAELCKTLLADLKIIERICKEEK